MKSIKNEKLIKRNGRIGQWTSLGALIILGIGMYISFQRPELFGYSVAALLIGFTLTQVGMYMGNRWGRSPRPDERIDTGLKGLPGDNTIYHYVTPASHFLAGPSGLWVLLPYQQRGNISFQKNRWRNSGGGFFQGYMRIFGQEGIGRPELEAENEIQALNKFFLKHMQESEIPEIKPIIIFTNDDVEIDAGDSPIPAMKLKQVKDFLRQRAKNPTLTSEKIKRILETFREE